LQTFIKSMVCLRMIVADDWPVPVFNGV